MAGVTVWRSLGAAANIVSSTRRPLLAHVVVTRFCNLDCAYCSEFDKVSKPVALPLLLTRIEALASLGTQIVTLTGGEPLTHPGLEEVIRRIRAHGMVATVITNGFLLSARRIQALNAAGLHELQISIDGVKPDAVSLKTLKSLRPKLARLARLARFHVNINSVLGISEERTRDALEVGRAARALGFSHTVGVLHDDRGHLEPLSDTQKAVYRELMASGSWAHRLNYLMFQKNLMEGKPNNWRCRAGARYLYICEDGLVHYCSQQRGDPGIPLERYGAAEIDAAYHTAKACAPYCTVSCVHQASFLDAWRSPQRPPPPSTRSVLSPAPATA
ncbi:MAG TPA: radical SAM protein [Caulobacteraceae bacterium]|nr:radical SAM protein [Caulobacteraceae bacterium]